MASFSEAFRKARKKFKKSGNESDFTFSWNGKKYNVLQKGETKSSLMDKYGDEPMESSKRPKARGDSKKTETKSEPKKESKDKESYFRRFKDSGATESSKRPKARTSGSAPKESTRPKSRETSREEVRARKKESPTRYKDDDKRRRTRATGTVPEGYKRVNIPGMARGGMVKKGSTDRKGKMFYKSGSPRGYK